MVAFWVRAVFVALVVASTSQGPKRVQAQSEAGPATAAIDRRFEQVDRMLDAMPELPESDRDAMYFRVDEQLLLLQAELNALAEQSAREMGGRTDGPFYADELRTRLDRALAFNIARIEAIGARINEELSAFEKFADSPNALISQAFVEDLRTVRLRYLHATLDQLESRTALGLPGSPALRMRLESIVDLAAQRLCGQIRLDAMTLEELRDRITAEPDDTAPRSALKAVESKQTSNLDALKAVIALQARLDMDTAEYRALHAQQRGLIGTEILDRRVFGNLLRERASLVRESVLTKGPDLVLRLLAFALVLLLAWLFARVIRAFVHHVMSRKSIELGDLRERTLVSLSYGIALILGTVVALSTLGISLAPMLAGLGIVSLIAGFALQQSLGNLAAGGMILLTRPYDLNDHVRIGASEGRVTDMSLIATTLAGADNTMRVVPNGQVWNGTITNFTRALKRRVDIELSVPYQEDLSRVESVLLDIIEHDDRIHTEPPPVVQIGELGESAASLWVRVWVDTPNYGDVSTSLRRRISERLPRGTSSSPIPA